MGRQRGMPSGRGDLWVYVTLCFCKDEKRDRMNWLGIFYICSYNLRRLFILFTKIFHTVYKRVNPEVKSWKPGRHKHGAIWCTRWPLGSRLGYSRNSSLLILRLQLGCVQTRIQLDDFHWFSYPATFISRGFPICHLWFLEATQATPIFVSQVGKPLRNSGPPSELEAIFLKFAGQHQAETTRHNWERWTSSCPYQKGAE